MKIAGLDLSISSSGVVIEDLDDSFEVKSINYYGFTQKKKLERSNIILYKNKDYTCDYQKYIMMVDKILEWCKDCEYIAVEDYAYGANGSMGMVFNLAEFEGNVKVGLTRDGKKLRLYAVNQIKKFFSTYGLSDKIGMWTAFNSYAEVKPDLSDLPIVDSGHGVGPTSDIIDAYAICEFLRKELRVRNGIDSVDEQPKHIKDCLTTATKEHPNGVLGAEFIQRA